MPKFASFQISWIKSATHNGINFGDCILDKRGTASRAIAAIQPIASPFRGPLIDRCLGDGAKVAPKRFLAFIAFKLASGLLEFFDLRRFGWFGHECPPLHKGELSVGISGLPMPMTIKQPTVY